MNAIKISGINPNMGETPENTFIGIKASTDSIIGSNNRIFGNGNIAVGYDVFRDVTTGSVNQAVGYNALRNCTTGSINTALGYNALSNNPLDNEKDKTDKLVKALEELISTQKEYIQTQKQHIDDLIHDKMILSKLLDTKNCTFEEKMNVFENLKG